MYNSFLSLMEGGITKLSNDDLANLSKLLSIETNRRRNNGQMIAWSFMDNSIKEPPLIQKESIPLPPAGPVTQPVVTQPATISGKACSEESCPCIVSTVLAKDETLYPCSLVLPRATRYIWKRHAPPSEDDYDELVRQERDDIIDIIGNLSVGGSVRVKLETGTVYITCKTHDQAAEAQRLLMDENYDVYFRVSSPRPTK